MITDKPKWTTLKGKDRPLQDFLELADGKKVYIGTDSQRRGLVVIFSTVIALVEKNNSVVLKKMTKTEKFASLRERLLHETWLSIEAAQEVNALIAEDITIHLDVNQDPTFKSGRYKNELTGFVSALGFDYAIKPNAWCASAVADAQVR